MVFSKQFLQANKVKILNNYFNVWYENIERRIIYLTKWLLFHTIEHIVTGQSNDLTNKKYKNTTNQLAI